MLTEAVAAWCGLQILGWSLGHHKKTRKVSLSVSSLGCRNQYAFIDRVTQQMRFYLLDGILVSIITRVVSF